MKYVDFTRISIELNPKTQMYDCYKVINHTCPCCGTFLEEERMIIKSFTPEEFKQRLEKMQNEFTF